MITSPLTPLREEANPDGGDAGGGIAVASGSPPVNPPADSPSDPSSPPAPTEGTGDFNFTLTGPEGDFPEGWLDHVGNEWDGVRSTIARYPSALKLSKAYQHAQQKITELTGDGIVHIPGADATDGQRAEFRAAIGVPETADAYDIPKPENMPEGVEWNAGALEPLKAWAHEHNLTGDQLKAAVDFQIQLKGAEVAQMAELQQQQAQQWDDQLRTTWGPKFEENSKLALQAAATFGFDPEHPSFKDPAVQQFAVNAAKAVLPTKLVEAETISGSMGPEAQARDIVFNESNPLHAAFHGKKGPEAKNEAKAKYQALMKQAFPE